MALADNRFFVTGGSLPSDNPSYVERKADRELHEALRRGEFCYVLTARQMGKSSLKVRTAARLREEGVQVGVLDLTEIGQNIDPEQWYYSLLCRLGEGLGLEEELDRFWQEHERLGPLRRFMAAIEHCVLGEVRGPGSGVRGLSTPDAEPTDRPEGTHPGRLVIFIDEIDVVRGLPFPTD